MLVDMFETKRKLKIESGGNLLTHIVVGWSLWTGALEVIRRNRIWKSALQMVI